MKPPSAWAELARRAGRPTSEGTLTDVIGLVLEARGCPGRIGDRFELVPDRGRRVEAEVVGIRGDRTLLMPLGPVEGLASGARVRPAEQGAEVPVGDALLGRVLDGLGRPIDGGPPPRVSGRRPLRGAPPSPLHRRPIRDPLVTGVRAIDGLLTIAKGQRLGIFAGGGVGKSTLIGMIVRRARLDVAVIALIGERGREVEEFVRETLGPEGLARSVVIAATSSESPLVRARGALHATAIAEHFRDEGRDVLLVMDSATRYAMALREVGLAAGEPPTTKGYTPSVFAALPQLLERAGTAEGSGSITALYTVLVEGDDLSDPIADAARAILDGHIVLSRRLAERGRFPAIDVSASISRCMPQVVRPDRMGRARQARELLATHAEAEDLVAIGAYKAGSMKGIDDALARMPRLEAYLRQGTDESVDEAAVVRELDAIWRD